MINDVKRGLLSIETLSGLTGKSTEKIISIGEEQTDVLLNGELVKVDNRLYLRKRLSSANLRF